MQFGALALPAEIRIDPRNLRRRLEPPAVVVGTLHRDVEADVALPRAELHRGLRAPEGTAHGFGFETLIGESILHLDADRATERVEAEHRAVGPHVGAVDGIRRDEVPVDGVAK